MKRRVICFALAAACLVAHAAGAKPEEQKAYHNDITTTIDTTADPSTGPCGAHFTSMTSVCKDNPTFTDYSITQACGSVATEYAKCAQEKKVMLGTCQPYLERVESICSVSNPFKEKYRMCEPLVTLLRRCLL